MKFNLKLTLVTLALVLVYLFVYFSSSQTAKPALSKSQDTLTIAVVVCGIDRVDESLVMIKSALIFNVDDRALNFVIVAETDLHENIDERLKNLKFHKNFTHEILALHFPEENRDVWRKLFKPCASQRLFLASLLPHIDALVYVDCDVLFVAPPSELFAHFSSFDKRQISALASESENRNTGWYTRFARHPYYGPFGLNSGVMLMNLTRMRKGGFESEMEPIYNKWRNQLAWGDQDIINIYFSERADEVHLLTCAHNYRPDHCMYAASCELGGDGIRVVHGNRGYFHKEGKQRIFREIYVAIEEYRFEDDPCTHLVRVIEERADEAETSSCNELINEFLHNPKRLFCRNANEIRDGGGEKF